MSSIQAPPIYEPLFEAAPPGQQEDPIASLPWILFFNSVFTGDAGTVWIPLFSNLTEVGTPTITGIYYQIGKICYFRVSIIPATSTTSTAGTTFINNFPLKMSGDGACIAVSGLLGSTPGMCDSASNNIYVPAWNAVTVPLSIVGLVEAS